MKCCFKTQNQIIPKQKKGYHVKKDAKNIQSSYFTSQTQEKSTFFQVVDIENNETAVFNLSQTQQQTKKRGAEQIKFENTNSASNSVNLKPKKLSFNHLDITIEESLLKSHPMLEVKGKEKGIDKIQNYLNEYLKKNNILFSSKQQEILKKNNSKIKFNGIIKSNQ